MRLLVFLQGAAVEAQIGYHRAFEKKAENGTLDRYVVLPYRTTGSNPAHWPELYAKALRIVEEGRIDTIFLQFFHGPLADPRPFIHAAKRINPRLVVFSSCGDPFGKWFLRTPRSLCQAASVSEVVFSTSMGYIADLMFRSGAKNVVLMPNGLCQERFVGPLPDQTSTDFDVVFIGSNNGGRNPFTPLSRAGRARRKMVGLLTERYGKRFGLFGKNWEGLASWQGPIKFEDQIETLRRARVQVGGFPGSYDPFYTSDRFFIGMGSGVPLADFDVPGVGAIVEKGRYWLGYKDQDELLSHVDDMLSREPAEINGMAENARSFMLERHTVLHRVESMLRIVESIRSARLCRGVAPRPDLDLDQSRTPKEVIDRAVAYWNG